MTEPTEEMITIPKAEYDALHEAVEFLEALEDAGVDNWPGYSEVVSMFADEKDPPQPA